MKKKISYKEYQEKLEYLTAQLGTLGGGNHFIELGKDEKDSLWVSVHTGSRNFGKKVCEFWQNKAVEHCNPKIDKKEEICKIKETLPKEEWNKAISALNNSKKVVSNGLEFIEGDDIDGYIFDMSLAQEFSSLNREVMINVIISILGGKIEEKVESIHNYINPNDKIIRKGAISAYEGEKCIIPFNMRDGILLCEGKGNPDWNFSAPHGAGRVLARGQAKRTLDVKDFEVSMEGIFSTSISEDTLDESPMVYKDVNVIEKAIEPTVSIISKIKPIHNLKEGGE